MSLCPTDDEKIKFLENRVGDLESQLEYIIECTKEVDYDFVFKNHSGRTNLQVLKYLTNIMEDLEVINKRPYPMIHNHIEKGLVFHFDLYLKKDRYFFKRVDVYDLK